MRLRVGYACICLELAGNFKTYRLESILNKDFDKIDKVIEHNLNRVLSILKYNVAHNIVMFRVSSQLIPFISNISMMEHLLDIGYGTVNFMGGVLKDINDFVKYNCVDLSLHLVEYTHINSVRRSVRDASVLEYVMQDMLLEYLGGSKIIMHMGGLGGRSRLQCLSDLSSRLGEISGWVDLSKLLIENDDRTFRSDEVAEFCKCHGLGWCFDYHHERCNPCECIEDVLSEYHPTKYHLSSGKRSVDDRSHADYIEYVDIADMLLLLSRCSIRECNVMFESKMKEQSIYKVLDPVGNGYWKLKGL